MNRNSVHTLTGIVLISAVILAVGGNMGIETSFQWEDRPMSEVLVMYHEGGARLTVIWGMFLLGSFLIIPSALLLHRVVHTEETPLLYVGTTFGVMAGFSYAIGIMRWLLPAQMLSAMYVDPAASENTRQIAETVFHTLNLYAGNGFGEIVAPISHALWLLMLGSAMLKTSISPRWMAWTQLISGIVIALRPLEYVGFTTLASISDQGVMLWAVILSIFGGMLLFRVQIWRSSSRR